MSVFRIINSKKFFQKYAPGVANYPRKVLAVNIHGNKTDFTDKEKKEVKKGIERLCRDLTAAVDNPDLRKEV